MFILLVLFSLEAASSCVILLHGLARTERSMNKLARELEEQGFTPINQGYPSRQFPIEKLAGLAIEPALEKCDGENVHFVTHSMGGILLRHYLEDNDIPGLQRAVMLAPPNQGSEVVDKLGNVPGFRLINGAAGLQLGTDSASVPIRLGPADFDLGIIAGTRSINLLLSMLIPGADDGKVSVEHTKLAGMRDHIQIPATHPFIMRNNAVIAQVIHYLLHGRFQRNGTEIPEI